MNSNLLCYICRICATLCLAVAMFYLIYEENAALDDMVNKVCGVVFALCALFQMVFRQRLVKWKDTIIPIIITYCVCGLVIGVPVALIMFLTESEDVSIFSVFFTVFSFTILSIWAIRFFQKYTFINLFWLYDPFRSIDNPAEPTEE